MLPALEHLRLVDVCCQQPLRSASLRKLSLAFTDSSDQPRHAAPVEHSSGPGASQQGGRIRQQYDLPRPDFDGCPNLRSLSVLGGVLPGVILDAWRPSLAHVTSLEVRDNAGDLGKLCCGDAEEGRAHRDLDIQGADRVGRVAVVRVDRGGSQLALPQDTAPSQSLHLQVSTATENEREGSLGLADLLEAVATHKNLLVVRLHAIHCHVRLPDLARFQHLDLLLLACQLGGLQNSRILESPTSSTEGQACRSSADIADCTRS